MRLGGYRPDRDVATYYAHQVNMLAQALGDNLTVYTDQPTSFSPLVDTVFCSSLSEYRNLVWDADDWESTYHRLLGWHSRNYDLAQYRFPRLVEVYLAKLGIKVDAADRFGKFIWIDAGLMNSVLGIDKNTGYNEDKLRAHFQTFWQEERELVALKAPKIPIAQEIIDLLSMVFRIMIWGHSLPKRCRVTPDPWYVVGGLGCLTNSVLAQIAEESKEVWSEMLAMNRVGTEENVLSVLRWRHGWQGRRA